MYLYNYTGKNDRFKITTIHDFGKKKNFNLHPNTIFAGLLRIFPREFSTIHWYSPASSFSSGSCIVNLPALNVYLNKNIYLCICSDNIPSLIIKKINRFNP